MVFRASANKQCPPFSHFFFEDLFYLCLHMCVHLSVCMSTRECNVQRGQKRGITSLGGEVTGIYEVYIVASKIQVPVPMIEHQAPLTTELPHRPCCIPSNFFSLQLLIFFQYVCVSACLCLYMCVRMGMCVCECAHTYECQTKLLLGPL